MGFQIAYPNGVAVPYIVERDLAASQAFLSGTPLVQDSDGNFAECGADPEAIAAFSLGPCGADTSGFNILAKKEFPAGKMQAVAARTSVPLIVGYTGTLPAADGGSYGIVKDTDSEWKVDFDETVAVCVKLIGRRTTSPENIAKVIVEPLPDIIQNI
jgi:hypothetical protein